MNSVRWQSPDTIERGFQILFLRQWWDFGVESRMTAVDHDGRKKKVLNWNSGRMMDLEFGRGEGGSCVLIRFNSKPAAETSGRHFDPHPVTFSLFSQLNKIRRRFLFTQPTLQFEDILFWMERIFWGRFPGILEGGGRVVVSRGRDYCPHESRCL